LSQSGRSASFVGQQSRCTRRCCQDDGSCLSPKMVNNVIQVVKMVVASLVNEDGEKIYPRTWNHEFIDMPEVKNQRQPTYTSEAMTAIAAGSKGREQMLYILLGATGMRIGEALGIEIDKHISDNFSTVQIRQKAWNGYIQQFLKSDNGIRDIDLHPSIAIERPETFLTSTSREIETAEVRCPRI